MNPAQDAVDKNRKPTFEQPIAVGAIHELPLPYWVITQ